ncbi:MAG: sulfurtransferase TusA family protein [Sulfolobaceae archaeon]|jgi:TusA-related sulfurtransferase|nr:sulfurtransferase TusA family protein [Sulfolobaceae archaeon]MDT7876253.1 sulfurtransferase TusA family protein [Sulfolobaceae archaeon]PVU68070.1 oxidoreductase [Sulfolobus sp. SCGC AB-777_G05]
METIDATSLECPEPFMKTVAKLMGMKEGTLKVMFKDPKCVDMITEAVKLMDCNILENKNDNGVFIMVIEKKASANSSNVDKIKVSGGC